MKNSLELIELSSINKVGLDYLHVHYHPLNYWSISVYQKRRSVSSTGFQYKANQGGHGLGQEHWGRPSPPPTISNCEMRNDSACHRLLRNPSSTCILYSVPSRKDELERLETFA